MAAHRIHPAHQAGERHDFPHTPQGPGRTTPQWRPQPSVRRGTEPVNARTDLELRRVLSRIFVVLFVFGTAAFTVLAARTGSGPAPNRATYLVFAALCTGAAVIALLDLLVIRRRLAAGQGRRPEHRALRRTGHRGSGR
ncbi:hypothetical protein CFP65_5808 [Kitasatospora sp. MMS16-BH015]|uniref:hypothetical protein n=1 Tax=Kitasatospora sp. MMS16-BH015 TaxID=2018025 RepID=UPI000CA351C0|nr:hypothetical protein [Kitasatospora sp. MMS16-BH015]AUG80490.1 hypothetical protein CFP65_5808 [Kitasatospora sp. MMS16-BH015]